MGRLIDGQAGKENDWDRMLRELTRRFGRKVLEHQSPGGKGVVTDHPLFAFRDSDERLAQASLFVPADAGSEEFIERWLLAGKG